jgi:hypothetical protein
MTRQATMGNSLLIFTLLLAAIGQAADVEAPFNARLRTLDGQTASGSVVRLSDKAVVLTDGTRETSFAPERIHSLVVREGTSAKWKVEVTLRDGSILHAASYTTTGGRAKITLADESEHELAIRSIRQVRLREQSPDLAKQWAEYQSEEPKSDRLVIRRSAEGGAGSLDVLDGVIGDVTDAAVEFETDGDVLKVRRERVDGLLYFAGTNRPTLPAAVCTVIDADGSRWSVRTMQLAGGHLALSTPAGLSLEIPAARLRRLDFASGNVRYLSELPRESTTRTSLVSSAANDTAGVFEPLSGRTPEGDISIGGQAFQDALWMPARSSLVVRVPEGFQRFQAKVGIDDRVGSTDGARLLIEGDGKVLFDQVIAREGKPGPIDIDLSGARRVRITVDYGGKSFLGDQLVLCEAMFTK